MLQTMVFLNQEKELSSSVRNMNDNNKQFVHMDKNGNICSVTFEEAYELLRKL